MQDKKIYRVLVTSMIALGGVIALQTPTMAAKWTSGMPKILKGTFTSRYSKNGGFYPTLSVDAKGVTIKTLPKSTTTIEKVSYRRSTPVSYLVKGTYKNGGQTYLRMMFGPYLGKTRISYKSSHLVNGQLKWTKHYAGWFYQK